MPIRYITGDATHPIGTGTKIIAHICNDVGAWGAGFVLALSKRWEEPERQYRRWFEEVRPFELGLCQLVPIDREIAVCNMIAQHGVGFTYGSPPIRYPALRECLRTLSQAAKVMPASIHMPRIGCGLAGGNWEIIEPIINETLLDISVTVYDLP
jgi:O-acetyl-ADP-ribose deacetylase (regulator of RNase III)